MCAHALPRGQRVSYGAYKSHIFLNYKTMLYNCTYIMWHDTVGMGCTILSLYYQQRVSYVTAVRGTPLS